MGDLQKFIDLVRWYCDEADLGYDQSNRWDVRAGGECDCATLVIVALNEAGFDTGSASYTGNLTENLCAHGWYIVANDGNPYPGDILLNVIDHVAVWLGDCLGQASIDENGDISGGESGDQSGWETNTRSYYNPPWDYYLRWSGSPEPQPVSHEGCWQGEMVGKHDTTGTGDDFAGVYGLPLLMVAADVKKYQAHTLNGEWLEPVNAYDVEDEEYGMAGDYKPIDAFRIYDDDVWYQTHNLNGDWNEPMHGLYDTSGYDDDFAGEYGYAQDAIRIWRDNGKEQPKYNVFS